jgi:alkylation response protein AidB-like acyl-CoA dehydrogenase
LELSPQQEMIRGTARDFFAAHCPLPRVRELEADELGYCPELWRRMAELDWLGLTYPEALGGAGGELLDLFAIYLEIGRALVPSPHLASAVLAGETLLRGGSEEQRRELLPRLARGEAIAAPALLEPEGEYGPEGIQLAAAPQGSGYRLDGAKILVPFAHVAEQLLVAARTGPGPDGVTLFLVPAGAPGIKTERQANIAGTPLFALLFEGARVPAAAAVGEVGRGWALLEPVLDRAAVLQCAEIAGAGERVLEMSLRFAHDRVQFGSPVGRYQAVQYLCSDVAIAGHLTSLLARQAAWRIDAGLPHRREVALAAAHASQAAQQIAHRAHEVQAGHGFMLENDLQLFTRRAKHWEYNLGDVRYHRERVAAALER